MGNFLNDFMDGLTSLWNEVVDTVLTSYEALEMFANEIDAKSDYMDMLTDQVNNGATTGVNLVEIMANYKFLVGDIVYYYTYMLIIIGLLFTIWKLVMYIFDFFTQFDKNKVNLGSLIGK